MILSQANGNDLRGSEKDLNFFFEKAADNDLGGKQHHYSYSKIRFTGKLYVRYYKICAVAQKESPGLSGQKRSS